MKIKLTLAVTLLAGLAIVLWALTGGGGKKEGPVAIGPGEALQPEAAPVSSADLERSRGSAPSEARVSVVEARTELAPSASATNLGPWEGQLAGIVGRILAADGTPAVDMRVDLMQADWTLLVAEELSSFGNEVDLALGDAKTDEEGRFRIDGAWSGSFHGIGIDLGGPRSTLRVIDHSLTHGELTDLGDIVLDPFGILLGKVVDERGKPVRGARIRVGALPEEIIQGRIYNLRPDTMIVISQYLQAGEPRGVVALPVWARKYLDCLPVPTTTSGKDGSFRLEGVPLARVVGGIDLQGFAGIPLGPIDMQETEHNLGSLTLTRGRTLRGVVLDAGGDPAPGVEVFAGAEVPLGEVGMVESCGESDADGRFSLGGVPEEGRALAIARRAEGEPYGSAFEDDAGELVIHVPTVADLEVRIVDDEGVGLSGARLRLMSVASEEGGRGFDPWGFFLRRPPHWGDAFREVEAGLYRRAEVSLGTYELSAEVEGFAPVETRIEVGPATDTITLTCGKGRSLALTVLDADSGEPVSGARAAIIQSKLPVISTLAMGWSDSEGRVRLGPFEVLSEEEAARSPFGDDPAILVVEHPGYASHDEPIPGLGLEPFVRLKAGGSIQGNIHWGGRAPERLYMIILMYRGADGVAEVFHGPKMSVSDPSGAFRFERLNAGEYRIQVFERFLNSDIVGFIQAQDEPDQVYRGAAEVHVGIATKIDIDLSPTGMGPSARITGTLRVDGSPLEGASVRIRSTRDTTVHSDPWGNFESGDIPVERRPNVTITADLSSFGGQTEQRIYNQRLDLKSGDVHRIDLELQIHLIEVEVTDASGGSPLAGATVKAYPQVLSQVQAAQVSTNQQGRARRLIPQALGQVQAAQDSTNQQGRARLMLVSDGPHSVEAHADGYITRKSVTDPASAEGGEVIKLELVAAIPCAGRVDLSGLDAEGSRWLYLRVTPEDGGKAAGVSLEEGSMEFSFDDLGPGTYKARVFGSEFQTEDITFVLGTQGDSNLILRF